MTDQREELPEDAAADRREFLKTAGKFAVVVPPAMTFLLSTTMSSDAIAKSQRCNSGIGDNKNNTRGSDGTTGDPGNSGGNNQAGDTNTTRCN